MKLKQTLIAASLAGAVVPLALFANGITPVDGMTFPNAVSEGDSAPTRVTSYYQDSSASTGSSIAPSSSPAPDSVTWFYPDGRVFHQHGMAFIPDMQQQNASVGSGFDISSSDLSGLSDPFYDETWIVAEIVQPVQPDYLVIVQ